MRINIFNPKDRSDGAACILTIAVVILLFVLVFSSLIYYDENVKGPIHQRTYQEQLDAFCGNEPVKVIEVYAERGTQGVWRHRCIVEYKDNRLALSAVDKPVVTGDLWRLRADRWGIYLSERVK